MPVYWIESVIVDATDVRDAAILHDWTTFASSTVAIPPPRCLLVHVGHVENEAGQDVNTMLMVQALRFHDLERRATMRMLPLGELITAEQALLRSWLITQRWTAWARASHAVRSFVGANEQPILLADAARQFWIPLNTLQSAAADERLPTIRSAGRHLIYADTI